MAEIVLNVDHDQRGLARVHLLGERACHRCSLSMRVY
jgi:hypothetical protein